MAARKEQPTISEETFAEGLASNLLHCRELGHSWSAYTATYDNKTRTYDRVLMCDSCLTSRHQVLDSTGEVVNNGYKYAEGYLAKNVETHEGRVRVPRRVFRLTAVQRVVTPTAPRKRKSAEAQPDSLYETATGN